MVKFFRKIVYSICKFFRTLGFKKKEESVSIIILEIDGDMTDEEHLTMTKNFDTFQFFPEKKSLKLWFKPVSDDWKLESFLVKRLIPSKTLTMLFQFYDRKGNVRLARIFDKVKLNESQTSFDSPGAMNYMEMTVKEVLPEELVRKNEKEKKKAGKK